MLLPLLCGGSAAFSLLSFAYASYLHNAFFTSLLVISLLFLLNVHLKDSDFKLMGDGHSVVFDKPQEVFTHLLGINQQISNSSKLFVLSKTDLEVFLL